MSNSSMFHLGIPAWQDQSTTTSTLRKVRHYRGNSTVAPNCQEKAHLHCIRFANDNGYVAWSTIPEYFSGVLHTSSYILTVEVRDGDAEDTLEVTTSNESLLSSRFKVITSPHSDKTPPRTELGRKLQALRERIVAKGTHLLSWSELGREVESRQGGQTR